MCVCIVLSMHFKLTLTISDPHLETSIFLTFILPWIISIPMLTGLSLFSFQMWTSLIFVSTANFIIPVVIYLKCLVFRRAYNADRTILTDKQRLLLKAIHARSDTIKDWVDRAAVRRRHRHGDGEGFKVALQQPDEEILEDMDNINTLPRVSPLLAGVAMESSSSSSASPVQQDSLSRAAGGGGANSSSSSPQQHRSPSPQRNRWYGKDDEQAGEAAAGASPPPIDKRLLSIRRGNTTLRVLFAADSAERKRQQQQQRGPLLLRNVTSRDSLLPPLRSSSVSQSSSSLLPSSSASLLHAVDNTNNNNYVIFEGGGSNDGQQVPANISTDQQPQSDPHQMVIDETVEGYLLEDVPDPFTEDQEMRKLRSRSTERSGFSDILERAVTTLGRRGGGGNNGTGGRSRLRQRADSAGIELRQDSFEDLSARRTIGGGGVGSSSSNLGVAGSRLQQLQSTSDGEVAYTTGGGGSSSASLPRLPAPITATTSPTTAQQQEQPMEITLTDTEGIQHNRDSIERRRRHTAQSLSPHRNSPSPDLLPNNSNKNNNNHLTISRANSAFFRAHTLPHHPQFVSSSVFRSVPQFITVGLGISPRWIAIVVLSLTTFVSVGSIILQIVNAAT